MTAQPWLRQKCAERVGAFSVHHNVTLCSAWTVLFGPSGTGKSTWLRLLAGLLPQHTGTLILRGEEVRTVPPHRRRVALVEQSPALFPHRDVERNVSFGSPGDAEGRELLEALLADFHLLPLRRAAVPALSGGERQRVAIARALCARPRVLLLDEVFTGMDTALRTDLIAVLQGWQERLDLPVLSVTHDISEVFATAGEVLRMQDGAILAQGSPAEVLQEDRADLLARLQPARIR